MASYSNGSQKSLGKIIVANFSSPQGLRQIGDSSFFATSDSAKRHLESQDLLVSEPSERVLVSAPTLT